MYVWCYTTTAICHLYQICIFFKRAFLCAFLRYIFVWLIIFSYLCSVKMREAKGGH